MSVSTVILMNHDSEDGLIIWLAILLQDFKIIERLVDPLSPLK